MVHDCLRGFGVPASPDGSGQLREQLDSLATRPERHPCARETQPASVEGEGPLWTQSPLTVLLWLPSACGCPSTLSKCHRKSSSIPRNMKAILHRRMKRMAWIRWRKEEPPTNIRAIFCLFTQFSRKVRDVISESGPTEIRWIHNVQAFHCLLRRTANPPIPNTFKGSDRFSCQSVRLPLSKKTSLRASLK